MEEEIKQLRQSMIASRRQKSSGRFDNSSGAGAGAGAGNGSSKAGGGSGGVVTHVDEVKVEMAGGSAAAGDRAEGAAGAAAGSTQGANGSEAPGGAAAGAAAAGANGGPRAVAEGTVANAGVGVAVDPAAAADGMERGAAPVETEEDEVRKKGWFGRLMHCIHWAVYRRLYASIHCFYVALIPATKVRGAGSAEAQSWETGRACCSPRSCSCALCSVGRGCTLTPTVAAVPDLYPLFLRPLQSRPYPWCTPMHQPQIHVPCFLCPCSHGPTMAAH